MANIRTEWLHMRRVGDIVRGAADDTAAAAWRQRALAAEARLASLGVQLQDGPPAQSPSSVSVPRALPAELRRARRRSMLRKQFGQHEAP